MDTGTSNAGDGGTFLTGCVSDEMSACEAAESTRACWTEAELALAPVIGRAGLGLLIRHGEEMAVRNVGLPRPVEARSSIEAFCDWVSELRTEQAVLACKAFLRSVESYLVSLVGAGRLRRILARGARR